MCLILSLNLQSNSSSSLTFKWISDEIVYENPMRIFCLTMENKSFISVQNLSNINHFFYIAFVYTLSLNT